MKTCANGFRPARCATADAFSERRKDAIDLEGRALFEKSLTRARIRDDFAAREGLSTVYPA
jgi:hypothetical protein